MRAKLASAGVRVMSEAQDRNRVNAASAPNWRWLSMSAPRNTRKPKHSAIIVSVIGRSTPARACCTASASLPRERASRLKRTM